MTDVSTHARTEEHSAPFAFQPLSNAAPRRICIHPGLTVGGPPDAAGMQRLAWEGFAAVVDLRSAERSVLAAMAEAERAERAGLAYLASPFPRFDCLAGDIDVALDMIEAQPRPLYLHCEDGQAALMLGLIGAGAMKSAGQMTARMAAWGAPLLDAHLHDVARAWFAARGLEQRTPTTIVAYD